MNRRSLLYLLATSCVTRFDFVACAEAHAQPFTPPANLDGGWSFTPNPKLPNVLIIGDSISIGYTRDVRRLLSNRANVFRPMQPDGRVPVNCGNTDFGLANLASWLGDTKWNIIHFNWGLHDLCYRNPASTLYGHRDKVHGVQDVPLPQYKINMEKLVERMQRTGAVLVWATTTVIPEGEAGRFVGDEVKYNQAIRKTMIENKVQIDDLYALTKTFPASSFALPGDVHYTKDGFSRIARQVADCVSGILADSHSS